MLSTVNATSQPIIQTTWGYKNESTGLYSGLIGDLQTGRAELGGKQYIRQKKLYGK